MEKDLYSNRSVSACIKAAYSLFVLNARTILRKTWLPVLAYALILTGVVIINIPDKSIHDWGMRYPWVTTTAMTVVHVLSFVCSSWLVAKIVSLLNGLSVRRLFLRSVVLNVFVYLYTLLATSLVSGYLQTLVMKLLALLKVSPESTAVAFVLTVAIILLLITICMVPIDYASTKYVIDPKTQLLQVVGQDFAVGMRHWGFWFLVRLIAIIIVLLIAMLVMIPFFVLLFAQVFNQLGMLGGDPDGTPSYFFSLFLAVSVLTFFVMGYELVWNLLVGYFAYGSVYTQEEEKKKHLKALKDNETTENTVY